MINRVLMPREMLIGGGSRFRLPAMLKSLGVNSPLLVCDPVMQKLGHADALLQALSGESINGAIFSEVVEDPTDISIAALVKRISDGSHDGLVALGGGSAMDTAKAGAIVATSGEELRTLKVPRIVDFAVMPVIAIPTTAGTGSEVTRAAVVTDTVASEKMLILGTAALPVAAIIDYELTLTCPYRVTVDTGIDALTHALEALVNRNGNAHSEALALSALKLIGANLEKVADNPDDRDAREAMMLGATHAGLAVSNTSTALIHGLSRPVGAFFHVPHGMSNAMVLPLVTQFSLNSALPHYAAAARALGCASAADSDKIAGTKLVEAFIGLNRRLKVPTPQEFGIDRSRYLELLPEMVRQGLASGTPANNPRVPTIAEMTRLYELAYDGSIAEF
ncbi:NAD-dependent methanol dehydrogenase [Rhizobium rhizogenes]|uniref:NAD-dependent methanol dehydrogenase n=1 Tax=Rhizobium rhizogenes TaxID=359 RepID=A0AAN2DF70_RHIRH|nr:MULTISPECIES: iron-containing alcohol dehydrogenase [Rhizobium/Agrobacterium group]AQS64463.1 iron-containing alcohol dehydrogenase [Rhizobium rhizogenes]MCZ7441532.1 iron-containing alcohol dehydrogenase [Rhizobium rhizogenes]NSZ81136.1 iron-containing alcohol dehydrogenase [Agrobacterium tumefaciens]OAM62485.1 alcohol dehydrogenase [Rhizobium rhizogenes]CAD0215493.1 NAD-dependent methanol dehydrogenase [Rhizobium rhizogenes]